MRLRLLGVLTCLCALNFAALNVEAQTRAANERRLDRNQRQMQRQMNRGNYYSDQAWQQINPWIQRYGINPLTRAADATRAAADRAVDAAGRAIDSADGRRDGQFGYVDRNNQGWFYDYYTYTPTYFYGQQGADRYAGAIRYFDSNNDGIFDTSAYYRDSQQSGVFDEYDRYDFSYVEDDNEVETQQRDTTTRQQTTTTYVGPSDARRHQVSGEIAMIKTAKVNGNENLVVALKHESEDSLAIDLGPAKEMRKHDVEVGKSIQAVGAMETIGEKQLLVAESVRLSGGETIEIDRSFGVTLTGNILDVQETTIGSTKHYMAIVNVEGESQLVDLGPVKSYKVKIQPETEIVIQGLPVRSRDHRVVMANRVRLGDEVITVHRTQSSSF